ncbi:MAG: DUF6445 family protein [Sphingomonadaceae bacterium]
MTADWTLSIERHGTEREPVVVIDNFVPNPDAVRGDAAMLAYAPMGIHYPGIRAAMPHAVARRMTAAIAPIARDVFDAPALDLTDAFYSLVTTRPEDLTPIQRLPHFDGVEPTRLALLHYLSPDAPGGTAFYRHRSSGFETVTAARLPAYRAALEGELARTGVPDPAYIDADTMLFEQVFRVEGRFNRAILYRGNRLHCAWLPEGTSFLADPAHGRLTTNLFLQAVVER